MTRAGKSARRLAGLCGALTVLAAVLLPASAADAVEPGATLTMPDPVRAALLTAENDATVAVAVLDTTTGDFYGSAEDEAEFPSESVVKVLIAADLLATGQLTGSTGQQAYQMITQSDDDDADALWGQVGGPAVVSWAEARYGISDLGAAPSAYGWWGNTKFTARGLVELYAAIKADPVVGPWLISAMSHMSATAADGTDQDFGLAAQTTDGAFKQGWGGDDDADDSEQLNTTGLLEGDRYAVAILVQHVPYEPMATLLPVVDAVAAAVAPGGEIALPRTDAPAPAPVTPTPSRTAPSTSTSPQVAASPASGGGAGAARALAGRRGGMAPLIDRRSSSAVLGAALVCVLAAALLGRRRRRPV